MKYLRVYGDHMCPDSIKSPISSYIYLHGRAEFKNGFDLVNINHLSYEDGMHVVDQDGIYPCWIFINGKKHRGKAYIWYTDLELCSGRVEKKQHGLVCFVGDRHYNKDALMKFKERRKFI